MSLKDEFKQELERIGQDMRSLGGAIKEKASKANQSIQKTWADVEPKIAKFESEAGVATDKAVAELRRSGGELLAELRKLKDRVTGGDEDKADDSGNDGDGEAASAEATDAEIVEPADGDAPATDKDDA